jgi:hypothetical protein
MRTPKRTESQLGDHWFSMSGSLFLGRPKILDNHSQNQSCGGRHDQADKTIKVGKQRSLLIQNGIKLCLGPAGRLDRGIPGMHKGVCYMLQPFVISRIVRSQMLRKDTLMELRALSQHGVGERDAETAALIAVGNRSVAPLPTGSL